jgi:hypothetical protein
MTEQYKIAEQLGERAPQAVALIGRIIRRLGLDLARQLAEAAIATQQAGGMLTDDGTRQRTLGGIFFVLVRTHLRDQGLAAVEQELFPRRQRQPQRQPQAPAQAAQNTVLPPAQGRLRPRVRGRAELPPAAVLVPTVTTSAPTPTRPPAQAMVLAALDRQLGPAPDIYRRSYNPETGALTLSAHFPAIAQARYGTALAAVAEEVGVPIAISPQPHHGMLVAAARAAFPADLALGRVMVQVGRTLATVGIETPLDPEILAAAQRHFLAATGWQLETTIAELAPPPTGRFDQHSALNEARRLIPSESGCYAIGAQRETQTLLLRFHFPDIARVRYAEQIAAVQALTGWEVLVHPSPHQEMLAAAARAALPSGITPVGTPSLRFDRQVVGLRYRGSMSEAAVAQAASAFQEQTGWNLILSASEQE